MIPTNEEHRADRLVKFKLDNSCCIFLKSVNMSKGTLLLEIYIKTNIRLTQESNEPIHLYTLLVLYTSSISFTLVQLFPALLRSVSWSSVL